MKYCTLILLICINVANAMAQCQIDTINITNIKSNFPIVAKSSDLQYVPGVRKWHYCYNVKGYIYPSHRVSDTCYSYRVNQVYADNYKLSYLETGNNIRMEYIWLTKNGTFWMDIGGLVLCRNQTLDAVCKHFNYSDTVAEYGTGPLIVGTKCENRTQYILAFSTGEPLNTKMVLIFDKRRKLQIIMMDYYNPANLKIEER